MKLINTLGKVEDLTMWNWPTIAPVGISCLQGYVTISYKEIVKIFGKETIKGDGYKVQAEWNIITPDGFATIYDYKRGKQYCGAEGLAKSDVTDWNIGGANHAVVKWVLQALNVKA